MLEVTLELKIQFVLKSKSELFQKPDMLKYDSTTAFRE